MSAALSLSNSLSDSVDLRLLPTLLGVVAQQVLFQVACKLSHMFLNPLVETMATLIIAVMTVVTQLQTKVMVNHTLVTANLLNNSQLSQCTMVVRQQLEVMVESDLNNHNNTTLLALKVTLAALLLNQCKVLSFLVNH